MRNSSCVWLLLLAPGLGFAQRGADFEARYWITDSTQRIKVTDDGIGTDINFKTDLGFVDKNFPEFRLTYRGQGRSALKIGYVQVNYAGDKNVQRTLDFSRETYTVGTRVISDLEIKNLRFGWAYQFVRAADGKFRLGSFVQTHGLWFRAGLAAPETKPPIDESERVVVPIPMVGIAMDADPHPKVNLSGDFSGMKFGKYGYAVDGELALKVAPVRHLGFTVGYRSFRLNPKVDPDFAVLRISGLFVGAFARSGGPR